MSKAGRAYDLIRDGNPLFVHYAAMDMVVPAMSEGEARAVRDGVVAAFARKGDVWKKVVKATVLVDAVEAKVTLDLSPLSAGASRLGAKIMWQPGRPWEGKKERFDPRTFANAAIGRLICAKAVQRRGTAYVTADRDELEVWCAAQCLVWQDPDSATHVEWTVKKP